MPNHVSSTPSVSPSIAGSAPVKDVIRRLQVRDPNRAYIAGYHRRMEDLEIHWRVSPAATRYIAVAVTAGALLLLPWNRPVRTPNLESSLPVMSPQAEGSLSIPEGIHPLPQSIRRPSAAPTPTARPAPENLHGSLIEPGTVELHWDSLGAGYRYILYSALYPTLENAQPLLEQPIKSNSTLWMPDTEFPSVWVSVRGVDPMGHLTAFSRPLLVQMPTE